ncbi:hypothetical protein D3C76_1400100 [compost metagenome]
MEIFQLVLWHLRQLSRALLELRDLRQGLIALLLQLLQLLPLRQQHGDAVQQRQGQQPGTGQADYTELAGAFMKDQARDAHCRSPRWPTG